MRQQQFLEVFLEGTRSRSGKPSPARAGMLSIVVDTMCTGAIGDVLVVPVGISYDRIIEGNYNSEQLVSVWMTSVATKVFFFLIMPQKTNKKIHRKINYLDFEFVTEENICISGGRAKHVLTQTASAVSL